MNTDLTIHHAELPAAYLAAQKALQVCTQIDECKKWADKAKALASYARQANDETLHRHADRIKARAIRRCGMLAKQIEPARGAVTARQFGNGRGRGGSRVAGECALAGQSLNSHR